MAAKMVARPGARMQLSTGSITGALDPEIVARHVSELGDAAIRAQDAVGPSRFQGRISLVVGDNVISHGLNRIPNGATVTPTVADATFAWAMTAATNRTMTIAVVGAAQPKAFVEGF